MSMTDNAQHGQWFTQYRDTGDLRAFERLLDVYHQPLFAYLTRLLRNRDDAEDALQEVWCKVIRQKDAYRDQGKFSSWLYRIAHNHCLDTFRKRKHRTDDSEIVENEEGYSWLDGIAADTPSPLDQLEEQELGEKLEEAVAQLPEAIREVYLLRSLQDIPFKEIAEIQEAPLGTVLSRMNLAVKKLRAALSPETSVEEQTA